MRNIKEAVMFMLLGLKMKLSYLFKYKAYLRAMDRVGELQWQLLSRVLEENADSPYGKKHVFKEIDSVDRFKGKVPIVSYDELRSYITQPDHLKEEVVLYNKTSGTTSEPKMIPVTRTVLDGLKLGQDIMLSLQYRRNPDAFRGKIVGIVSPAYTDETVNGIKVGSASGHFYKNVPKVVESRYVIPYRVFEIADYPLKYYAILLFCLAEPDVSYIATANPTTFLLLYNTLKADKLNALKHLKSGEIPGLDSSKSPYWREIQEQFQPGRQRIRDLEEILTSEGDPDMGRIWPKLRMMVTWTGGSCGTALNVIRPVLPDGVEIIDLGYIASEIRATITLDYREQSGTPTFRYNFFEFIPREAYEAGRRNTLLIDELEQGEEYYVIITTPGGLYRYDMNDIVVVTGHVRGVPLLRFLQKGKGVCNITGEKLYEAQVLRAVNELSIQARFLQCVADENSRHYILYLEPVEEGFDPVAMSSRFDESLREINVEYGEKRSSERLGPLEIRCLKYGSYEKVKAYAIDCGQSESQFKTVMLQYRDDVIFPLEEMRI